MSGESQLKINSKYHEISNSAPTYFIADIAANHDGSLLKARNLIKLAAEAGANAAKFQNFRAETIVSKRGFVELGEKLSHQASWDKSVFQAYKDSELPLEWTDQLIAECELHEIDYFTAPYDLSYISILAPRLPFFKVGSGDITWKESLDLMISYGKPIMVATGASDLWEVQRVVKLIEENNVAYVLMQCNTNYTGSENNFDNINLLALNELKREFPKAILGLSDHSHGSIAVLGAIALGARVVEKHFTDNKNQIGPDHSFSLNPTEWSEMVQSARTLERCMGDGRKKLEKNEIDAQIVQRRALRYSRQLRLGDTITSADLIALRPCPNNGIDPWRKSDLLGKKLLRNVLEDELVTNEDFK